MIVYQRERGHVFYTTLGFLKIWRGNGSAFSVGGAPGLLFEGLLRHTGRMVK